MTATLDTYCRRCGRNHATDQCPPPPPPNWITCHGCGQTWPGNGPDCPCSCPEDPPAIYAKWTVTRA
jgi:hypothetical protein